ncbi:MAG: tetratricopeptide repeat protein [Anaerolineae bacterium]|nr:tetratricopeptide repeat protein [Anaerolineae bacterium]
MTGQNSSTYKEALNQGHSAAWDQDWERAAQFYRKAVEEFPDNPVGLTSLGLAYFELKRYDEALAIYGKAAKLTPEDPLPIEKLATIYERSGNKQLAADHSMAAADLWLKLKDADKAIENWTRVTALFPEHIKAHSRLAVVHERLGRNDQAARSYINVAALLQDAGQINEAMQAVNKAVEISPINEEAQQALELVKANKTLPKPRKPHGGTGMLQLGEGERSGNRPEDMPEFSDEGPDPFGEARQKAMTALAGLLFDVSEDDIDGETGKRGLAGVFGSGGEPELEEISLHIGQTIDYQTRGDDKEAAKELKKAISSGLNFPAAFFNVGFLYYKLDRNADAIRFLQSSVQHPDFALAARLMTADIYQKTGRYQESAEEYLEALKEADSAVVAPEYVDQLRQQYEPYLETLPKKEDEEELKNIINAVIEMIVRPGWRKHLVNARGQIAGQSVDGPPTPLAEMLSEAQNSEIVEAMAYINQLAREGHTRSAMEEAYMVVQMAPTYLPLHIQMGELLLRLNNTSGAINKFVTVAQTYASRGEAKRATDLLRRIVEISPMDQSARRRLISRLIEQGQVNNAIIEYVGLADVYYRLAQLDKARSTYEEALRLAQQNKADPVWSVRILKFMADIDIQKLDWRQAMRVYEQLRNLAPDDVDTRKNLIELNVRMGKTDIAKMELDNYITFLSGNMKGAEAVAFLEKMISENDSLFFVRRKLAEIYQESSRPHDALAQWDKLAEQCVASGETEQAKEAIRAILILNPPNANQYRTLLQRLD